ncbi:MAG: PASTA domain-containing protein [Clostridia bacterium]|nr:PASTA domain-containing protein [Clostridia bacterium]
MKKNLCLTLIIALILLLTACAKSIEVPDVIDTEESVAKNVISSNGLIPVIKYEYDDQFEEGYVIRTIPDAGSPASKNDKVEVYISKGAAYICAHDATISWYNVGTGKDEWNFSTPYIQEGKMYIECSAIFKKTVKWKNGGFGEASINDTFNKTVPIKITNTSETMQANKEYEFTLEIPISDLEVQRPTTIFTKLVTIIDGEQENLDVSFSISW